MLSRVVFKSTLRIQKFNPRKRNTCENRVYFWHNGVPSLVPCFPIIFRVDCVSIYTERESCEKLNRVAIEGDSIDGEYIKTIKTRRDNGNDENIDDKVK